VNRLVIASVTALCLCGAAGLPAAAQAPDQDVTSQSPPPPPEPQFLDMSAIPAITPDRVMKAQQALQRKGFDPGPVDGILGPMTREAVRKYQDRYGIKPTGELDNQTLYALGGAELASRPGGSQ
jgi:peptidoglycan hydrolase-like protein with peptidoglycan-binding domain